MTENFENNSFTFLSEFDKIWSGQAVIEVTVLGIIMTTSLVGNIMVIAAVYRRPQMRTITNYFISNLAVADLVFACWIPLIAITRITNDWIFGMEVCKLVTYVQFLSGISSILTMMVISIERYKNVMFSPKKKMTKTLFAICMLLIWIISACFPIPVALAQTEKYVFIGNTFHTYCGIEWPTDFHVTVYLVAMGLMFFLIPLAVIILNYFRIYVTVRDSTRAACTTITHHTSKKQMRLVKMFTAIVVVFVIMWCPFFVISFVAVNYKQVTSSQFTATMIIVLLNTCQNPIIYGYFNLKFRKEFKTMCKCCMGVGCSNSVKMTYSVQTDYTLSSISNNYRQELWQTKTNDTVLSCTT